MLYVHCRGGHGRTGAPNHTKTFVNSIQTLSSELRFLHPIPFGGTICALLLAKLYGLPAREAMARAQLYHDVRQQPVFCAEGYEETLDGSSCLILFPSQRQQVLRLLGEAVVLDRACSGLYGPGASKYRPEIMARWQEL